MKTPYVATIEKLEIGSIGSRGRTTYDLHSSNSLTKLKNATLKYIKKRFEKYYSLSEPVINTCHGITYISILLSDDVSLYPCFVVVTTIKRGHNM